MTDLLAYRIPNQDIIKKTGNFHLVSDKDTIQSGFIISSFDQRITYAFKEDNAEVNPQFNFHFSHTQPVSISKEKYMEYGNLIKTQIENIPLDKFVFSRIKKVYFDALKTQKLFDLLCKSYPQAFVYLISSKEFGTWLGASPEALIKSHNDHGFTMALAGTKENLSDIEWKRKEYREQELVSEYILETLKLNGVKNIEVSGPYQSEAGNLVHLRSDFSFDMDGFNTYDLAKTLHPTPAVCGLPKKECTELIETIENKELRFSRSLYTGYLGIVSPQRSQLYVNLRCCQIFNDSAFLYLGGGYTEDSDVLDEWNETERKSETLLNIFELL